MSIIRDWRSRNKHGGRPVWDRLWEKVEQKSRSECWPWISPSVHKFGYGLLYDGKKQTTAHRVAYQLIFGALSSESCVLHHCDNPACCNPWHMFIGSKGDNIRDAVSKGRHVYMRRALCKRGHVMPARGMCVECSRIRGRVNDAKRRLSAKGN